MRVVFFGTPDFAVPSLEALLGAHDVALVVTRPDRPAGRGLELRSSPVSMVASEAGVALLKPAGARGPEVAEAVRAAGADAIVVAAYGRILPLELLESAPEGGVNVHASLLPRWRGASPIAAAIAAGDEATGISIMRMEEGLDTGPVLLQRQLPIAAGETTGSLTPKLARLGAEALLEGLSALAGGAAQPQPQDGATYAPVIRKADGDLEWDLASADIDRRARAYDPWPGVRLPIGAQRVRILGGRPLPAWTGDAAAKPGEVLSIGADGIEVMTGDGPFMVTRVQPPGKRAMPAAEYARGRRDLVVPGAGRE
jgi:methionyl-tRNA formyltransferase